MRVSEIITNLGKDFNKNFSIENEPLFSKYKEVYTQLLKDGREKEKKGVLLVGSVGSGKSMLMRVMQRLFKDTESRFKWANSSDLKDMIEEVGVNKIKEMYGKGLKMDLYIDEIGASLNSNHYGNNVNIISEIISERNELFVMSGFRTHFSSNIPPFSVDLGIKTLSNIYGDRCYDRMVEMCELISWSSKSLRK